MAYPILGIWTGKYFLSTSIFLFQTCAAFIKAFRMSFKYLTAPLGVFLILYFAYTMLGVMLFGEVIFNWQNPIHGFYTLFRFILGDFSQGSTNFKGDRYRFGSTTLEKR